MLLGKGKKGLDSSINERVPDAGGAPIIERGVRKGNAEDS